MARVSKFNDLKVIKRITEYTDKVRGLTDEDISNNVFFPTKANLCLYISEYGEYIDRKDISLLMNMNLKEIKEEEERNTYKDAQDAIKKAYDAIEDSYIRFAARRKLDTVTVSQQLNCQFNYNSMGREQEQAKPFELTITVKDK
jgi:hypothetical protein